MKKSWMILSAIMISSIAFAQNNAENTTEKERGAQRGEEMKSVLALNDAQYASISEINKKYKEESKAKWEENRKEMKAIRDKRQAEVDKVLTPDQRSKWAGYKQGRADARKAHMHKRHGHHGKKFEGRRDHGKPDGNGKPEHKDKKN